MTRTVDRIGGSTNSRSAAQVEAQAAGSTAKLGLAPRWAVIGIFLLLLIAALAYARAFFVPVILSLLLSLVFSPVRRTLERAGMGPGIAAGGIVFMLVAVILLVGFLLMVPVTNWIDDAPQIGAKLELRLKEIRQSFGSEQDGESVTKVVKQIEDATTLSADEDVQEVVVKEQNYLGMLASTAPSMLVQTALVIVLLFFMLASGDMFYEKLVHVLPTFQDKRRAITIAKDIERKLSQYLLTITAINAGLGLAVGLAMWALGMPNPLMWGVIAWLFNYIPYIGAIAGSLLTLVVGMLSFDTIFASLIPSVVYYSLTAVEGQFVTPYFVGRNLKLNTVVVFISVTFWAWLWSVVGMLVAVPMLVALRTICEHIPPLEPYGDFLSARGAEVEPKDTDANGDAPSLT